MNRLWRAMPLVATALITAQMGASAAPRTLDPPDQHQLAEIAHRYLAHRATKVTTGPQTPGFSVATTPAMAAELRDDDAWFTTWRAKWQRYTHSDVFTTIKRFDVAPDDRSVVAHVYERTDMQYHDTPVRMGYSLDHLMTFERDGSGWLLADVDITGYKHCGLLPETQQSLCPRHDPRPHG